MMQAIARVHILALPHTWSSRKGERFVAWLYTVVTRIGFVQTAKRGGEIVGVVSGLGRWILTLVVHPDWQRKGIGSTLLSRLPGKRYVYTEADNVAFYTKVGFRRVIKLGRTIFLWRTS